MIESQSIPEKKTVNQLDGLTSIRFFLAISIVLFHNCEEFSNTGYYFEIISRAYCAVSGFFLLSGLILAYNYDREYSLKAYFQNRSARIYPLYLLSLIFAFPLFLYYQYKTNANYIGTIIPISIVSILMIQSWSAEWLSHLNPPTWSLSVEAFLYLIFPLSLFIIQRLKGISLYIIPVFLYIIVILIYSKYPENLGTGANPIIHIPTFILGIFTGILLSRNKLSMFAIKKKLNAVLIFSLIVIAIFVFLLSEIYNEKILNIGLMSPFFICIFLLLAYNSKLLSSKILIRLGEISYAIYLLHHPIKSYLFLLFKYVSINNDYLKLGLYLIILITLCNYIYLYFELPLHKKLKYNSKLK